VIRDLRGAAERRADYDVCVVGSGPAGLALAHTLAAEGKRVGILESGGIGFEPEPQHLNLGDRTGFADDLVSSRPRLLGGASAVWEGHCAPLDPEDFAPEPWSGSLGWPIGAAELAEVYPPALRFLEIEPRFLDAQTLAPPGLLPPRGGLESKLMVQRRTRLGASRRSWLEGSAEIELWTHATCVSARRRGRRIEELRARDPQGGEFAVSARAFVLAAGGIENPRLLLSMLGADALPIEPSAAALVGRYFSAHPHFFYGSLLLTGAAATNPYYVPHRAGDGTQRTAVFQLDAETRRSQGLVKALFRHERPSSPSESEFYAADALALWRERSVLLEVLFIQSAMPMSLDNRVALGATRDAHGVPRVRVSVTLEPRFHHDLARSLELYVRALGESGRGRVRFDLAALEAHRLGRRSFFGGHHFMCATRMAARPAEGVVDRDLRLFGCDNLYLSGASVFGAPAAVNPTLTATALSIRLGRHLATRA
jgi:choline dehydrogenase-like flavoprotein